MVDKPINLNDDFYAIGKEYFIPIRASTRELYGTRKLEESNCQLHCESVNDGACEDNVYCFRDADNRCYSKVEENPCPSNECEMVVFLRTRQAEFDWTQSTMCKDQPESKEN